ncbi:TIGR04283 family arsenosugar biosynthesis glycosyltransferase [Psychroflexus salis]|uniref:Glycosyl hydrolase n=1 Tax=Psychroflexus salis TaxID=1526574 RepID=A0A916ZQS5_9FLAO|nr:TIGR04283 family arsenosugar biosynthesis glycosyltransferase [Psychroflexus salis]GGE09567.1 glycosyl hydrolase [Psychroflexus salis]
MISIIIPVYNEAKIIKSQLLLLQQKLSKHNYVREIIVVDGGSTDQTFQIASTLDFIKLIKAKKGRAKQMNTAAKIANEKVLYFLHIDSTPPKDFDYYIAHQIQQKKYAGCFCMKFDSAHPWLMLMSWFTKLNHKACRGGDQSLFITKKLFNEVGRYNETYQIYEDNILIGKLYNKKQFTVIQKWITASPRLYRKLGVWKLQWIYLMIYFKKWRGAKPDEIYSYFQSKLK